MIFFLIADEEFELIKVATSLDCYNEAQSTLLIIIVWSLYIYRLAEIGFSFSALVDT